MGLVHQVRGWYSGAAAYFGWMREAKRDNTRCGLRPMSDKAGGRKTRGPEGCDENGPAAALLLGHVSIQICFLRRPPCRRPILIATPLYQSRTWCTRVVRSRGDGVYAFDDAGGWRIGASASRLPSRHGGTEPISTPRKRPSGVRTLTKRGPAAFPAPSSQVRSASTCLAPASSFCGRSFQTRKTSFRSSSRATEPPGARVALYGSELGAYCVLSFS